MAVVIELIWNMLPDSLDVAGDTMAWVAAKQREWLGGRYVTCRWDMEELLSRETDIVKGDKLKLDIVFSRDCILPNHCVRI